ncbi:hypothetical protein GCM10011375_00580 [Hymenobacter qilianensis]|uniref:Uncharacterized protein n=1 Tax=Hymenobacter qilianensis TaxID=1385715 RepID=A0ACB5PKW2_9BACT|nr:hypothetical protein [Hymenobacter qilianensis]GGF48965.1 hypothetical protein GCM10011375_00580 [Hymenobacter qilianensis]
MQEESKFTGTAQLDATIQALQGGNLAGLAPQASSNIQNWISTLQNSNNGQLSGIASELERLNDALSGSSPDTLQVQQSLKTLGEHTMRAAESADPGSQEKVRQLGQALSSAASQIH